MRVGDVIQVKNVDCMNCRLSNVALGDIGVVNQIIDDMIGVCINGKNVILFTQQVTNVTKNVLSKSDFGEFLNTTGCEFVFIDSDEIKLLDKNYKMV